MGNAWLAGTRVLLVEDETLVAMLLEDALAELGCEVVGPVARLDAAAEAIERDVIDCALIDINLQGRPAYPLAERLAARGVPFGFVTGYEPEDVEERFRGRRPVLRKPCDADQLRAALLDMTRARRQPRRR